MTGNLLPISLPTPKNFHRVLFSRYQIRGELGRSGGAVAYEADDLVTQRPVMLKVLLPELYSNPSYRLLIYEKIKKWSQLSHPAILPIIDMGLNNNQLYWSVPLLKTTVARRIKKGQLSQVEIIRLLDIITSALDEAHRHKVWHGNLKPSNILFDSKKRPYLTDFHLIHPFLLHQIAPLNLESAIYLPPEIFTDGQLPISRFVDSYSLGILLFTLLTGSPPYTGKSLREVAQAHLFRPIPTLLRPHTHTWQPIINRALAKNPQERYVHPQQFKRDLHKIIVREPILSRKQISWIAISAVGLLLILLTQSLWPYWAAMAADPLRSVLGNQRVAKIEEIFLTTQDDANRIKTNWGLQYPASPWVLIPTPAEKLLPTPTLSSQLTPSPIPIQSELSPIPPLGTLEGEGIWQPYLYDYQGHVVAHRTFLQPDPIRPFALVAVVTFDLQKIKLHYVLGSEEPSADGYGHGEGIIPIQDKVGGYLLATFNGGFKTTHGQFGAMSQQLIAVPPKYGLGTIAFAKDGSITIGRWGEEIDPSADWLAYRQNAPLILQNGDVNQIVYSNDITDWGGTIDNETTTWRSALGLNNTQTRLYYIAGSSLSMPLLAQSAQHAGIADLMLLDINHYWVHFAKINSSRDGIFSAEPLFTEEMAVHADRYLHPNSRDFFYVTLR